LPPTSHPDFPGVSFEWVGPNTLLNFDLSLLPELPREAWEGLKKIRAKYSNPEIKGVTPATGRCNHGSHNLLSSIAVGHARDGESLDYICQVLLKEDARINPDVSYFICPSRKEWKTKDREANCRKFVTEVMANQVKKGLVGRVEIMETKKPEIKIKEKERVSFPKLSGYGQELFDLCYSHSPVPKSRFSSAAVLSLASVLMGNKYSFGGIQPNLYSILITGQGGGKDFPLKFPKQVLDQVGLRDLVGMSNPASDVSLIMNLENQRTRIDTIDEVTRLFRGMGSKNSPHLSSMAEMLNELYSAPSSYFGGKTAQKYQDIKANKKGNIGACFSPYITLASATTFSGFEKTFTDELFESGLGSRFLYIIDDKSKPPKRIDPRFAISPDLKAFLNAIHSSTSKLKSGPIDLERPRLFEMQATEKANLKLDVFSEYCYAVTQRNDKSTRIKSMHNRLCLHAQKLAMIDAVFSSGQVHPKITEKNVEWAINWVLANVKSVENYIDTMISSNNYEAEMNKIESIIFLAGDQGITRTNVSRQSRKIENYKKHLERLIQSEEIFKVSLDGDAPQLTRYVHKSFVHKNSKLNP
jgi:hypothetical protein